MDFDMLQHHPEEMIYHENCTRSVLLQQIDKFKMVLVRHEDPAVYKYFKWIQYRIGSVKCLFF